jgi:hypothetical protein
MRSFTTKVLLLLVIATICSCRQKRSSRATKADYLDSISAASHDSVRFENQDYSTANTDALSDSSNDRKAKVNQQFDQYEKTVPKITINGKKSYLIEGDVTLDRQQLFNKWYQLHYNPPPSNLELFSIFTAQTIVQVTTNGTPITWPKGSVLKFCVLASSFPNNGSYTEVKNNFIAACNDWQQLLAIKFEYHAELDNTNPENGIPPTVDFVVRYQSDTDGDEPGALALAFYKNDTSSHEVKVFPGYFTNNVLDKTGIFRHEIGHILGFLHESISPQSPMNCLPESITNIQEWGTYDCNSIMHALCGQFKNYKFQFTHQDTIGFRHFY